MKNLLLLCSIVSTLWLSGCATKPIAVPTAFWEQPATPVAIVVTSTPKQGDFVMQGNQGLLDVAIAAVMTAEVRAATKKVDASRFMEVQTQFAEALTAANFVPVPITERLELAKLPARRDGDFDRDLSAVTKANNVRYVLVLELLNYGALRSYYAFMPTSAPSGFAAVRGRLVDTKDYKVIWDTGNAPLDCIVQEPVAGQWKQPPAYQNLMTAAERAMHRSRQYLVDRFFETKPTHTPAEKTGSE